MVMVVAASGCAATGGGGQGGSSAPVSASGRDGRDVAPEPAAATSPAPTPEAAPVVPPTTATTRAITSTPAALAPPTPFVPTVTIVALAGGAITRNDGRPCSNISSATQSRGQLEVRRTGPTDGDLVVSYGDSGIAADYLPLPGQITIPAGTASAVLLVDPAMTFPPPPAHVHRSSSLAVTVNDGAAYDVGPESSAAIGLTFDVDLYGCPQVAA